MPTAVKGKKNPYRILLLKKRMELLASAKSEPDALATDVRTPDDVEFAARTAEQDITAATMELRARMLKQIDRSLRQLAEGTYGVCVDCGEEISPNRLKAIPWAQYCLSCQEKRSRN